MSTIYNFTNTHTFSHVCDSHVHKTSNRLTVFRSAHTETSHARRVRTRYACRHQLITEDTRTRKHAGPLETRAEGGMDDESESRVLLTCEPAGPFARHAIHSKLSDFVGPVPEHPAACVHNVHDTH